MQFDLTEFSRVWAYNPNQQAKNGASIGYARVSTQAQSTNLQLDALAKAGCTRVSSESTSGAQRDRPELARALDYMRPGDTLVVWKLDRLARSSSRGHRRIRTFPYAKPVVQTILSATRH